MPASIMRTILLRILVVGICGGAAKNVGLDLVLVTQRRLRGLEMVGIADCNEVVPVEHDGDAVGLVKESAKQCPALDNAFCLQRLAI